MSDTSTPTPAYSTITAALMAVVFAAFAGLMLALVICVFNGVRIDPSIWMTAAMVPALLVIMRRTLLPAMRAEEANSSASPSSGA